MLAVLEHLITNRDCVVPKIELLDEIWQSRFVSELALTSWVKSARQVCGDNGRDQRVIPAGDHLRAVEYLRMLGETSARKSAFAAATDALLQALAHVEQIPAQGQRNSSELRVRLALGPPLVSRLAELVDQVKDAGFTDPAEGSELLANID